MAEIDKLSVSKVSTSCAAMMRPKISKIMQLDEKAEKVNEEIQLCLS
jgi:hypothetical protein